jgi:hypothetical protein
MKRSDKSIEDLEHEDKKQKKEKKEKVPKKLRDTLLAISEENAKTKNPCEGMTTKDVLELLAHCYAHIDASVPHDIMQETVETVISNRDSFSELEANCLLALKIPTGPEGLKMFPSEKRK